MRAQLEGDPNEITITDPAHVSEPVWFASNVLDFTYLPSGRKARAYITREQFACFNTTAPSGL